MKVISLQNPATKKGKGIYSKINFERDLFINIVGIDRGFTRQLYVNITIDPDSLGLHFGSIESSCFSVKNEEHFDKILTEFSIKYLDLFNRSFLSAMNETTVNDVLNLVLLSLKYDFEETINIPT